MGTIADEIDRLQRRVAYLENDGLQKELYDLYGREADLRDELAAARKQLEGMTHERNQWNAVAASRWGAIKELEATAQHKLDEAGDTHAKQIAQLQAELIRACDWTQGLAKERDEAKCDRNLFADKYAQAVDDRNEAARRLNDMALRLAACEGDLRAVQKGQQAATGCTLCALGERDAAWKALADIKHDMASVVNEARTLVNELYGLFGVVRDGDSGATHGHCQTPQPFQYYEMTALTRMLRLALRELNDNAKEAK